MLMPMDLAYSLRQCPRAQVCGFKDSKCVMLGLITRKGMNDPLVGGWIIPRQHWGFWGTFRFRNSGMARPLMNFVCFAIDGPPRFLPLRCFCKDRVMRCSPHGLLVRRTS